jgi:hypothetical protein
MNNSIVSFFNNLPQKQCSKCGAYLEEQADCYLDQCFDCMELNLFPLSLAPKVSSMNRIPRLQKL